MHSKKSKLPSPRAHIVAAMVVSMAAVLSACAGNAESGSTSMDPETIGTDVARAAVIDAEVDNSEPVRIASFLPTAENEYIAATDAGTQFAAEARNATVTTFDAAFDPQTQYGQVQDAIASGQYDAFIIDPVNSVGLAPVIAEAADAGIKVVCGGSFQCGDDFGNNVSNVEGVLAQTTLPQEAIGVAIGRLIVEACADRDPCKVAQLPGVLNPAEQANFAEIERIIAEQPGIEMVARVEAQYLTAPAEAATQDILTAHPDLDVIATMSTTMAEGADLAVTSAGLEDQVAIISLDGSERSMEKVRNGEWFGVAMMYPVDTGMYALDQAVRAVRSQPFEPGINPVEELPWPEFFTVDNQEEFGSVAGQWGS